MLSVLALLRRAEACFKVAAETLSGLQFNHFNGIAAGKMSAKHCKLEGGKVGRIVCATVVVGLSRRMAALPRQAGSGGTAAFNVESTTRSVGLGPVAHSRTATHTDTLSHGGTHTG